MLMLRPGIDLFGVRRPGAAFAEESPCIPLSDSRAVEKRREVAALHRS